MTGVTEQMEKTAPKSIILYDIKKLTGFSEKDLHNILCENHIITSTKGLGAGGGIQPCISNLDFIKLVEDGKLSIKTDLWSDRDAKNVALRLIKNGSITSSILPAQLAATTSTPARV